MENELKSQGTVIMGSENEYSVNINIKLKYLIWDNKNERIASYGVILKTESLMGVPKSPTYEKIATELAQDIIEASPIFKTNSPIRRNLSHPIQMDIQNLTNSWVSTNRLTILH